MSQDYRGVPPPQPKHHRVSMFGEFIIVVAWVTFMALVFIAQPWVTVTAGVVK